jgi:copper chaperone CopZ
MKFLKSIIVVIIALTANANLLMAQSIATQVQTQVTKTIDVKVKGITCSKDLKTIGDNVEKLAGVSSCKAIKKGATTTFEVIMNPSMVTDKAIYTAIENTGGCKNPNDRPYKVKL